MSALGAVALLQRRASPRVAPSAAVLLANREGPGPVVPPASHASLVPHAAR